MIDPIRAEEVAVPVFITQEAHQLAQQFAHQQPDDAKAHQVQLNTLAVCAVHSYFKILGIPSDPSNCDSWNPLMRMTTNVADLDIVGRGRIECRPVTVSQRDTNAVCYVPTEVQGDRMAYVVVQIEPDQPEALILGFVAEVDGEMLPLRQLQPMSELPKYLHHYHPDSVATESGAERVTRFTDWMQGQITAGWKTLDELMGITPLNYQWRGVRSADSTLPVSSRIVRGKVIDIPTAQGIEPIVLVAELIPKSDTDLSIELKIAPTNDREFLPAGLEMTVVDAVGEPVMTAQARAENRMVELGFHAELGDRFQLKVQLNETVVVQSFWV